MLQRLDAQFALALQNLGNAETAHRLELADQAERLRVIEPAGIPEYPVAPNRKKLAAMGTAVSTMLALMLALLVDMRRPVIRSATQMERELGIRPVVTVPHFASPYETRQAGRHFRIGLVSGAGLVALCAVVVAFSI